MRQLKSGLNALKEETMLEPKFKAVRFLESKKHIKETKIANPAYHGLFLTSNEMCDNCQDLTSPSPSKDPSRTLFSKWL